LETNAHRTLRISLVAAALLLLFATQGFAAQTYRVRRGDTLYLIAKKFGTTVTALQKANHLRSPNRIRAGRLFTIPSKAAPSPRQVTRGRAAQDKLEVTSDGKVIATLAKDTRFIVLGREGEKFNIKLEDGRTGWVPTDAVSLEEGGQPLPASDLWGRRHDIVRTALAYRGSRYRHGGTSSRSGFDCSGFVKFVYATKGIKLPHDTRALFKCGKPIAKSDLQPGDILFFVNTYRRGISHVGLYIGNGKFVHASTHRRGVRIDDLDADYYRRHYMGARRIE